MTTELADKLAALETLNGYTESVISVYLNLGPGANESRSVAAKLKNLLEPIATDLNGLDHDRKMARRRAIGRILEHEPKIAASLGRCVAVFVGEHSDFEEVLVLPRKSWDVAVAAPRPYLRPLLATMDAFHTVATVVVDPRRSEIFVTNMGRMIAHEVVTSESIRKSDFGGFHGLDEHRTRNRVEETHIKHFRALTEHLAHLRETHRLQVIFIGGRDETVTGFTSQLPDPLRGLVGGTFNVDVHTATPAAVATITAQLEDNYDRALERRLVASIVELAGSGGLAVIGLGPTIDAANVGAIEELVVAGTEMAPGWVCGNCGWLTLDGPECRGCGETAQPVIDVIEWLVARVRGQGGRVEQVMIPTELDDHRVGARIRFHA